LEEIETVIHVSFPPSPVSSLGPFLGQVRVPSGTDWIASWRKTVEEVESDPRHVQMEMDTVVRDVDPTAQTDAEGSDSRENILDNTLLSYLIPEGLIAGSWKVLGSHGEGVACRTHNDTLVEDVAKDGLHMNVAVEDRDTVGTPSLEATFGIETTA
jgi:hypothetical protein